MKEFTDICCSFITRTGKVKVIFASLYRRGRCFSNDLIERSNTNAFFTHLKSFFFSNPQNVHDRGWLEEKEKQRSWKSQRKGKEVSWQSRSKLIAAYCDNIWKIYCYGVIWFMQQKKLLLIFVLLLVVVVVVFDKKRIYSCCLS